MIWNFINRFKIFKNAAEILYSPLRPFSEERAELWRQRCLQSSVQRLQPVKPGSFSLKKKRTLSVGIRAYSLIQTVICRKIVLYLLNLLPLPKPVRHLTPVSAQLTQSSGRQVRCCCWTRLEFHFIILLITALLCCWHRGTKPCASNYFETEYI